VGITAKRDRIDEKYGAIPESYGEIDAIDGGTSET
jgi:hypothetical protein